MKPIRANLWFDTQAEDAARFYISIFKDSKMGKITLSPEAGHEITNQPPGSVLIVTFELNGQPFLALNGGPNFTFSEAISFELPCKDQAELDYYWDRLSDGGDPAAQQCGWLKDKFGVSWQVVPENWEAMATDPDQAKVERVMSAMFEMKKLDFAGLQRAFDGA